MSVNQILDEKYKNLRELLRSYGRLAVAFSGGVDSAFLLKAATEALPPENVLAVTARAAIFPRREFREAAELAAALQLRHLTADLDFVTIPQLAENPPDRCYHCKKALFQTMIREAGAQGFPLVADGGNLDDADDFRPGARAVRELGVRSPLKEARLTKADIRRLSAELNLPTWNKPACACLASRFPYGQPITGEQLKQVEQAEELLLSHGFRDIRVRCHGPVARIEVGSDERSSFFDEAFMDTIDAALRALGFTFVSLDLRGFRSGGFNHSVDPATLEKYRQ
ncbi:MAG: ATP-dependent sacrificial sulfur transferase LarE [Candidatus Adiutrix sp.]|jgi:uncharacterized protein|nr:ATP-dependent sacrificial sulfur transferase LarE [Candidatus Adiutrix sp.]